MFARLQSLSFCFYTGISFLAGLSAVHAQPYAYVANLGSWTVAVVNTANNSIAASINVPAGPSGIAVTPDGATVYVSSLNTNTASAIRTSDNSVHTIGVGVNPTQIAVSPNGALVYVIDQGSNQVSVISNASQSVIATIGVGSRPSSVAFSPDGSRAYVSNLWDGTVSVINTATNGVSTFATGPSPMSVAVTSNGQRIYVATQGNSSLSVHDASGNLVQTIGGFSIPVSMAATPDGSRVFVVNQGNYSVSMLSTASNSVIATSLVGSQPTSIAVSTDGSQAYVTNEFGFSMTALRTSDGAVLGTVPGVGIYPAAVATIPAAAQQQQQPSPPQQPTCSYSLSPGSASYPSGGGNGSVTVTAPAGCAWSAGSNSAWLAVTGGASGNGSGTVFFSAAANQSTSAISGSLTIAGQTLTVSEAGISCSYSLSSYVAAFTSVGGAGSVIAATSAGCAWNVSSDAAWLSVTSASSGFGTGTVLFLAGANLGAARSGNLHVGGLTFNVTQSALLTSAPTGTAAFVGTDTTTQGSWKTKYGGEGYSVPNDVTQYPAYAQVSMANQATYIWNGSTADVRAPQKAAASDRIASTWYSFSNFYFDINLTDGKTHQVGVYCLDWDQYSRAEAIDVLDAGTGALLDTRQMPSFVNGQYLVWNLSGHVRIRATVTGGINAVVSGLFFGSATSAVPATATAAFVGTDTTTQGSWKTKYGADGYSVPNDGTVYPAYAQVSMTNQSTYLWNGSTADVRAPQKAGASDRIASTWYSFSNFYFDVNLTDGKTHQVGLYALDWDQYSRAQAIDVLDAGTGALLDTRQLSSFVNGQYLVWNLSGHVRIRVTVTGGINAVVSGLFFGSGITTVPTTAAAAYVGTDTTTQGSWKTKYGADGYSVPDDVSQYPAYAQVSMANQASYLWNGSTADVRAPQKGAASDRIASTWYSYSNFTFDINLTDGQTHKVSLYALDWDQYSRAQAFEVLDATTGALLDTRQISSFVNGQYIVWNLSGHVRIRVTVTGGINAVVSGLFFN